MKTRKELRVDLNLSKAIEKYIVLKSKIKELTTELLINQTKIKNNGVDIYIKYIETNKKNPESFYLTSTLNDKKVLFSPTKRYINIDEKKAIYFKEKYGSDIIIEEEYCIIDHSVIEKHKEKIISLLEKEGETLYRKNKTYKLNDNKLNDIFKISKKTKININKIIEDIQQVFMIK